MPNVSLHSYWTFVFISKLHQCSIIQRFPAIGRCLPEHWTIIRLFQNFKHASDDNAFKIETPFFKKCPLIFGGFTRILFTYNTIFPILIMYQKILHCEPFITNFTKIYFLLEWALNLICKSDHAAAPAHHNHFSHSTGRKYSPLCDTAQTANKIEEWLHSKFLCIIRKECLSTKLKMQEWSCCFQHAIITTLIALVTSVLHFVKQHKLQTREEWLSFTIPLHYKSKVRQH